MNKNGRAKRVSAPLNFPWLPTCPNRPIFANNPWRPGKPDVFDHSQKLKDLIGNMVLYYSRMVLARLLRRHKWSDAYLQDYFLELSGLATKNIMKGIFSWRPQYGLATFCSNHVTYATMTLAAAHKNEIELVTGSPTINSLHLPFDEAMNLAERYIDIGEDEAAARTYAAICDEVDFSEEFSEDWRDEE